MRWLQELQQALTGCWRLVLRDTGGYDEFDNSLDGFWRSFSAIVIVAPLYLYAVDLQLSLPGVPGAEEAEPHSLAASFVSLVIQWFAWPAIVAAVAYFTALTAGYTRYVIAYNWSSILVMTMQLIPIFMLTLGGAIAEFGGLLFFITLAMAFYYRWYVAMTGLGANALMASALVAADFAFGITVTLLIE